MRTFRRYRRQPRYGALQRSMADARSGEVVFVAHCLLNQNTRYLGGAVCPGVVRAALEPYLADGTGIVQLPCPEQRVWGGVLKTRLLWVIEHPRVAAAAPVLLPVAQAYLRWRYQRLARAVARDIEDYQAAGMRVRGVVGVAGSPSCGVHSTVGLKQAAAALAGRGQAAPTAAWLNATVVEPATRPGPGLFITALLQRLHRLGVDVPVTEYTLGDAP